MDKLRKTSNIPPTTLSASISDTDTTIPLSSTVGAETSTCIDIVIDRIDAAGEKTPDKMEVVTVLISGNNGTNAVRGRTAPAMPHEQGAVVEYNISTSVLHNDLIDGMLENFTPEGKLKDKLSLATKDKKGVMIAKGDGTSEFDKVTADMIDFTSLPLMAASNNRNPEQNYLAGSWTEKNGSQLTFKTTEDNQKVILIANIQCYAGGYSNFRWKVDDAYSSTVQIRTDLGVSTTHAAQVVIVHTIPTAGTHNASLEVKAAKNDLRIVDSEGNGSYAVIPALG